MVIKGSSRGADRRDIGRLAKHLLSAENEAVAIVEMIDVASSDLFSAFEEMRALSRGTRCRKSVYHASINLDRDEADGVDATKWHQAANELGRRLGMEGHQRVLVLHTKHGRPHLHVVWGRVHPESLRTASDSGNYRKHEQTSRALERHWNLKQVRGVHTRPADTPRPVAVATHSDWQASIRTGVPALSVAARLADAWAQSRDGTGFRREVESRRLSLAWGRRGVVAVDEAGTPHALSRRLGLKAAKVRERIGNFNEGNLPTVSEVQARIRKHKGERAMKKGNGKSYGVMDATTRPPQDWNLLEEYWRQAGAEDVQRRLDGLWVQWLGTTWHDSGDRITLHSDEEPTDKQIAVLVKAGKARGWKSIRFFGSEEFQHRARLEALRQGFRPEDITLECEQGKGGGMPAVPKERMPEHVRKRLGIPDPDAPPRRPPPRHPPPPRDRERVKENGRDIRSQNGNPTRPKPNEQPMSARDLADIGLDEVPADFVTNDR